MRPLRVTSGMSAGRRVQTPTNDSASAQQGKLRPRGIGLYEPPSAEAVIKQRPRLPCPLFLHFFCHHARLLSSLIFPFLRHRRLSVSKSSHVASLP